MTTEHATRAVPSDEPTEIQVEPEEHKPVSMAPTPRRQMGWSNRGGMQLRTMDEAYRFADMIVQSGWAPMVGPKDRRRPMTVAEVFAAIQLGAEVGLPPMRAVQNIAVINGRPTIWGDAMLALCRMSGRFDDDGFKESFEGQPGTPGYTAISRAQRVGSRTVYVGRFSVADAQKAGLWDKPGPWQQYPNRMLQVRARTFCLRDGFADVLCGLHAREEVTADEVLEGVDLSTLDTAPLPEPNGGKKTRGEQVVEQIKRRRNASGVAITDRCAQRGCDQARLPGEPRCREHMPSPSGDAQVDAPGRAWPRRAAPGRAGPGGPETPPEAPQAAAEPETPPAPKATGPTKARLVEQLESLAQEAAQNQCDVTGVVLQLGVLSMAPEHLEKLPEDKLTRGAESLVRMIADAKDAAEQAGG